MSQAEQDLITEINALRVNPGTYATYLENLKPFFKGKQYQPTGRPALLTEEGWSAAQDAINFLRATKPVSPLAMSAGLIMAAQVLVKEQSGSGATGHKGANRTLVEERVKPYGTWQGAIGENLSYGNDSARDRVLTWLIDDGFATRGHRKRLVSSDYRVGGLSCGTHPEYGTVCCLTLAGAFTDRQTSKTTTTTGNAGTQTNKSTTTSTNANKASTTSKNANVGTQTNKAQPTSRKVP